MIRVLDTTALSAAMRGDPDLVAVLRAGRPGEFAIVPPVISEIEYGIRRLPSGRQRELLEIQRDRFMGVLRLLQWTQEASTDFGDIKANLESRGELIDDFDIAIAAIARVHGASVITANFVHFRRVESLSSSHWTRLGSR